MESNSVKVDVVIASHLNTANRVKALKECLKSINLQIFKPENVYLSYSIGNIDTANLEYELKEICPAISIFRREERHSQFEHICRLLIEIEPSKWICFQDDDDISLPNRLSEFAEFASKYPGLGYFVSGMAVLRSRHDKNYKLATICNSQYTEFGCYICRSKIIPYVIKGCNNFETEYRRKINYGLFDISFRSVLTTVYRKRGCTSDNVTYLHFKDDEHYIGGINKYTPDREESIVDVGELFKKYL